MEPITTMFICGPTRYSKGNTQVQIAQYSDGQTALVLLVSGTSERALTASVNMAETQKPLPPDKVYIKDWSENEGVLKALLDAGLVVSDNIRVPAGFSHAHRVTLAPGLLHYLDTHHAGWREFHGPS